MSYYCDSDKQWDHGLHRQSSTHGFFFNVIIHVINIFHNLLIIHHLFFTNVIIIGISLKCLIVAQCIIIVLGIEREICNTLSKRLFVRIGDVYKTKFGTL